MFTTANEALRYSFRDRVSFGYDVPPMVAGLNFFILPPPPLTNIDILGERNDPIAVWNKNRETITQNYLPGIRDFKVIPKFPRTIE